MRNVNLCGSNPGRRQPVPFTSRYSQPGLVNGRHVDDIVLDTGCNQTMVHSSLVGKDALIPGLSVDIRCAHGDVESYPVVNTTIVVQDQELDIQACVEWSEQLRSVTSVWLGAAAAAFKSDSAPAGV